MRPDNFLPIPAKAFGLGLAFICTLTMYAQTPNIFPSSGNVGIGTGTPAEKLDMSGGALAFTTTFNPTTDVGYPKIYYGDPGDGSSGLVVRAWKIAFKSGNYTDSTTKIFINNNGNVGIGTTTPVAPLHFGQWAATTYIHMQQYGGADNQVIRISGSGYNGTERTAIDFVQNSISNWNSAIAFSTTRSNVLTEAMRITSSGNVGIGTTNPQYPLSVSGTIQAKEVIVNTGWSDYVFEPTYRLRPLSEIAAFIKDNHHLPEIPTEAEVKERGVSVGEMQAKLLAKIEELTLHMIQAQQERQELKQRISELENAATAKGAK